MKKLCAYLALSVSALAFHAVPAQASVGGTTSSQGAVVQLWSTNYKATNRLCSGTHIGKGWIVTAKHCVEAVGVEAGSGNVVWGNTNIDWNNRMTLDQKNGKITKVVKNVSGKKDIALLKSDALANDPSAATMPIASLSSPASLLNTQCTAYGYGIWTENMDSDATLPWNQRSVNFTITRASNNITESTKSQIEATGANGAYLNTGDSGGALVCGGKLSGVTVAVTRNHTNTFMGITGVDRTWIRMTTGI